MMFASSAFAQKTVVVDAGAGAKQELVYNSAGQMVETRTIGPDGKLQVRNVYDFPPNAYAAQRHTTTNYYPDGKTQSVSIQTFDENANFTGDELIAYNAGGTHTAGRKMVADPSNGIRHCWTWDGAGQKYKAVVCPAGEEERGEPEPLKPLTQDDALKQLAAARRAAIIADKATRLQVKAPVQVSDRHQSETVGIVLPAFARVGEQVSGSVVLNPEQYEGYPELNVTRVTLPAGQTGALAGWTVEISGMKPQRANRPFTFRVPGNAPEMGITLRAAGDPSETVSQKIRLASSSGKGKITTKYQAQALCAKNDICTVAGQFSGDATAAFAAFGEAPANVVAETSTAVYLNTPSEALRGPQYLIVTDGSQLVGFAVTVAELEVNADKWEVKAGENILVHLSLDGPGDMPEAQWAAGDFPSTSLQQAREFNPNFRLQHETREQHEEREREEKESKHEEAKAGVVVLAVRNLSPELVSFRGAKDDAFVFQLIPGSFHVGAFQYNVVVQPKKDGVFSLRAALLPFVAPVNGQQFRVPPEQSSAAIR